MTIASGDDTDHDERPVLADHLTLGHRRPVAVEDPEDGRQLGPRFDLTAHEHVAVADVRPARLASHDRRVCTPPPTSCLFLPRDAAQRIRIARDTQRTIIDRDITRNQEGQLDGR